MAKIAKPSRLEKEMDNLDKAFKEKSESRPSKTWNIISTAIIIIAGTVLPFLLKTVLPPEQNLSVTHTDSVIDNNQVSEMQASIRKLDSMLNQSLVIKDTLLNTTTNAKQLGLLNSKINAVDFKLTQVQNDLNKIQDIIINNPEKALTMPLLKQQLEDKNNDDEKERQYLKDDINRLDSNNNITIGLFYTMLIAFLIPNISTLISKK